MIGDRGPGGDDEEQLEKDLGIGKNVPKGKFAKKTAKKKPKKTGKKRNRQGGGSLKGRSTKTRKQKGGGCSRVRRKTRKKSSRK